MSIRVIGLTGGIGSGKSTVADEPVARNCRCRYGCHRARTDRARRGEAMPEIVAAFGEAVVAARGEPDRAAMRTLVFADPAARQRLESILHPRIRQEALRRCAAATGPYVLLVVPC